MLANYLKRQFAGASDERLHALYLDDDGHLLDETVLAEGGHDLALTRARKLFAVALAVNASGVILAHNHPSGVCHPSADDVRSTDKLRILSAALDIELLDHLIVTSEAVYSMRAGAYL